MRTGLCLFSKKKMILKNDNDSKNDSKMILKNDNDSKNDSKMILKNDNDSILLQPFLAPTPSPYPQRDLMGIFCPFGPLPQVGVVQLFKAKTCDVFCS